jgi:Nitroreductase family
MAVAGVDRQRRPRVDVLATPIDRAIAFGCNAPNPHNTQAWKFRNTSELETLFYVDEERLLPVTDPPARQIHIGCGCFIETLSVGATTMGFGTTVEAFPEGTYGLDEVGEKPVARITLTPGAEHHPDALSDYLYARQTNRRPSHRGAPVSDQQFAEIAQCVRERDVEVIGINDRARLDPLLAIFDRAMTIECETPHLYEETRVWFRFNERERAEKRDGLSAPAAGLVGLRGRLVEWYLKHGDPRRWYSKRSINASLKVFRKGLASAEGLLVLKTATNTQADWIKAGRAYARASLAAEKLGLEMHPCSQVLQEYPEMTELQRQFNELMGVAGQEKIQMAVRIGKAPTPYYSYRRHQESLVTADQ